MKGLKLLALAMVVVASMAVPGSALAVPPLNDSFAAAVELAGRSVDVSSSNQDATKEPDEPNHAGEPGGASLWYRWTAPASGEATVTTCGSEIDTLLAAYTGGAVSSLTEVASNDNQCDLQSAITLTADEGETYRIAVDGLDGETGLFELHLRLAPSNDDFADAIQLAGDQGSIGGTNAGASLEASEPQDVTGSVWYRWTAPSTGPATFLTCGSSFDTAIAVYTGSQLDSLSFVTYNDDNCGLASIARFEATGGTTYSVAIGGCCGESGDFTLGWNRDPPPPHAISYPSIAGLAREGETLTGSEGQWAGSPTSFAFAWGRCDAPVDECTLIPGATGRIYTVSAGDIGSRLFIEVTAVNAAGSATEYSDVTAVVRPRGPANSSPPQIFGRAAVGQTLDATAGAWTGQQPIQYAYQWQACSASGSDCRNLAGEIFSTVRIQAGHLGSTLRVVVTASNPDGSVSAVSGPTGVVVRARRTRARRCVVPNVRGKTLRAARAAIGRRNCRVGRLQRRYSGRMRAGRVVSQRPRAGARLAPGARVHLVVSRGRRR